MIIGRAGAGFAAMRPACASLVPLVLAACSGAGPAGKDFLAPGAEGIDVSHHNGAVEWPRVAATQVSFVYIKATEGVAHVDPRFQANWQGAGQAGLARGAYHFYLLCRPGLAQAANFIRQVEVGAHILPPAVDLEHAHNCAPQGGHAETLAEITAYLAAIEAEYGAVPVIYTTPAFHAEWLAGEGFERHPLWIRRLGAAPDLPHAIWQYDMRGRVAGIAGPVDLNRAAE